MFPPWGGKKTSRELPAQSGGLPTLPPGAG